MNLEEVKRALKPKLGEYLQQYHNIQDLSKNFNCLNPTHNDQNPSMGFKENNGDSYIKCFSCGETYDLFSLVGIDYNLTEFKDQVNKACQIYGISPLYKTGKDYKHIDRQIPAKTNEALKSHSSDDFPYSEYFKKVQANLKDCNYLQKRGISLELQEKHNIGYDPNYTISTGGQSWQAIIIPTSEKSFIARNINVDTESKYKVRAKGSRIPLNLNLLETNKNHDPIFIVEGEIDALSVEMAGAKAIGLGGDQNIKRLLTKVKELNYKDPLIILFDNDKAGETTSNKLKIELDFIKANSFISNKFDDYNDPNEFLIKDKEEFKKFITSTLEEIKEQDQEKKEEIKKEYLKNNAVSNYIQDFINGISKQANTPYISTGFKALDEMLDGGLYEGLYILGAISSLGKTTLALQIADQIAQQETDVLIFSLEMAKTELMAKSISRNTIIQALKNKISSKNAKTNRGITVAKRYPHYSKTEIDLIEKSVKEYSKYANHLFISEGVGDIGVKEIKETVKRHIEVTGNKPVVLIDYLQILAPADLRASDKQNTDKAVLELKRLSRDYKIPVLAISSLNRENYKKEISMTAFKESGAIEYGSDVLIGLQLAGLEGNGKEKDIEEKKSKEVRDIELRILKNRNGKTGTRKEYKFYTLFNYFEEV